MTKFLPKILGLYAVLASLAGLATGFFISTLLTTLWMKIFALSLFGIVALLGIIAGTLLLLNRSDLLAFFWGFIQVPWLQLTLKGFSFDYNCSMLFGLPVYFVVEVGKKVKTFFGFYPYLGGNIKLAGHTVADPNLLVLGFGLNLASLLFLALLIFARRRS